jgi:hypothetical protein
MSIFSMDSFGALRAELLKSAIANRKSKVQQAGEVSDTNVAYECATGSGFQITLDLSHASAIGKRYVRFQSPGLPFGSVNDATRIMSFKPCPQIVR